MPVSLQDGFLAECRQHGTPVTVSMMSGLVVHGTVKGFDPFTVLLDVEGKTQLIYKHAISTIAVAERT
jgi:host factor-I protein